MSRVYIACIIIFLILISSIVQFGNILGYRVYIFEISIILSIFLSCFLFKIPKKIINILFFFIPVIFLSIINSILENSVINFLSILFYFLSMVLCITLGANLDEKAFFRLLNFYMIVICVFHFIGLINPNINNIYNGYSGIFTNPNAYGVLSSFSFVFIYLSYIANNIKFNIPIYVYLIINILGVLFSVSRSSFLCLLVSVGLYYLLIYTSVLKFKIQKKYLYLLFLLVLLMIFSFYFGFFDKLIQKNAILENDLSSGRFDLWKKAFASLKFYGYGPSYYVSGESATHNNYLNIGVVFGASIMVSLIFFWITLSIYLLYFFQKYKLKNVLVTLCILIYTITYWMFEVGSSFFFVWVVFIMLGYSCYNIKKHNIVKLR